MTRSHHPCVGCRRPTTRDQDVGIGLAAICEDCAGGPRSAGQAFMDDHPFVAAATSFAVVVSAIITLFQVFGVD